jgi:hypothetical protein
MFKVFFTTTFGLVYGKSVTVSFATFIIVPNVIYIFIINFIGKIERNFTVRYINLFNTV